MPDTDEILWRFTSQALITFIELSFGNNRNEEEKGEEKGRRRRRRRRQ